MAYWQSGRIEDLTIPTQYISCFIVSERLRSHFFTSEMKYRSVKLEFESRVGSFEGNSVGIIGS